MRVSCSSPIGPQSEQLIEQIKALGLQPIVTPILVRAVYEGSNRELGEKIVELFRQETKPQITVG